MKINILIPVYNDWKSVTKLMQNINFEIQNTNVEFSIIIVNDGSTDVVPKIDIDLNYIKSLKILNLKKNMSHQRSIAIGLRHIYENENFDYVIPMDGDGEDRPEEIKEFIKKIKQYPNDVIVGERVKRSEGIIFKIGYSIHKLITYIFTGKNIKFGNFTCISKSKVNELLNEKATWNSYSGSLSKITENIVKISSIRGKRYFDLSKMSYLNLAKHSLSIISVFKSIVILRSIIFFIVYSAIISTNISLVTLIPLILIIIFIYLVITLSKRENLDDLNNSLSNISNIDVIKQ